MKKHKENQFIEKFQLLNSQEASEEINWSLSESSDYENHQTNSIKNYTTTRKKRKRVNHKEKDLNNLSYLEVTVKDAAPKIKKSSYYEKSPILLEKSKSERLRISPILTPGVHVETLLQNSKSTDYTPEISQFGYNSLKTGKSTSPILLLKSVSPRVSLNVRKRLFNSNKSIGSRKESSRSTSPIFKNYIIYQDKRQYARNSHNNEYDNFKHSKSDCLKNIMDEVNRTSNREQTLATTKLEMRDNLDNREKETFIESTISKSEHDSVNTKIIRSDLVTKVKSYFSSNFSSQSSQHSISEYETPTPNSSSTVDEIDIINPQTQNRNTQIVPSLKNANIASFESHIDLKPEKIKYKKDGLAYRLNVLLKNQNSCISLWQHERFLAANSNFIIPKENFLAFRIKSVDFNYSVYLLEVVNVHNEKLLVVINSVYVYNNDFDVDDILKIYQPYCIKKSKTIDYKIITNVCKYTSGK